MRDYVIDITSMKIKNGKELRAVEPNSKGIYVGLPALVIGSGSRSSDYVPESLFNAILGPEASFKKRVEESNCEGEHGHPFTGTSDHEANVNRLLFIDRTRVGHIIKRVHHRDLSNGDKLVFIDVKPHGPYGKYLAESLQDEEVNTAFSMRTLCYPAKVQPNGRPLKDVSHFITIDSEGTPGYEQASKRYRDGFDFGTEALTPGQSVQYSTEKILSLPCSTVDLIKIVKTNTRMGFESRNNQLYDILRADNVVLENTRYIISTKDKTIVDPNGDKQSVFHRMF